MNNWIRIKDQKPEDGQDVFYFFDVLGVYKGRYLRKEYPREMFEEGTEPVYGDCFYGKKGFLTDDVTHWMPAPTDGEWDKVLPDGPEDYVKIHDGHFDGWAHKDNVLIVRKDRYEGMKAQIKYLEDGHKTGLVCPDDDCPCHIYWQEEHDGYRCGCCLKTYPTEEVESGHPKYISKYERPCPHCNPHKENTKEFFKNGFLVYTAGVEPYITEHYVCEKCYSTYCIESI